MTKKKPYILIEVESGVATTTYTAGVDVVFLDWDNIEQSCSLQELEEYSQAADRIRDDRSRRAALERISEIVRRLE